MDWIFRGQTDADIDRIAEAHYDRLWELYWGTDEPDAWDTENPGWREIAELVDGFGWKDICGLIRDFIEGDGDLMVEAERAGALDAFIRPEERGRLKDPDDEWDVVDAVFDREWDNDEIMKAVYLWLPDVYLATMCERLIRDADTNGLRDKYNDWRRG